MKTKPFFYFVLAFWMMFPLTIKAQSNESKTITLVVSGEGSSKEEATKNALRSAIEQAFGTFVSANTSVVNDEIVCDEIASISSGNIEGYEVVSTNTFAGICNVTLKATVSIGHLITYAKNKGMSTELAGATFAMNAKIRKLNKENEMIAFENFYKQMINSMRGLFDYEIKVGDPLENGDKYRVPIHVVVKANRNTINFISSYHSLLKSISMTENELNEYKKANSVYGKISFHPHKYTQIWDNSGKYNWNVDDGYEYLYYFRNDVSVYERMIKNINKNFIYHILSDFEIQDNIGNKIYIYFGKVLEKERMNIDIYRLKKVYQLAGIVGDDDETNYIGITLKPNRFRNMWSPNGSFLLESFNLDTYGSWLYKDCSFVSKHYDIGSIITESCEGFCLYYTEEELSKLNEIKIENRDSNIFFENSKSIPEKLLSTPSFRN